MQAKLSTSPWTLPPTDSYDAFEEERECTWECDNLYEASDDNPASR